MRESPNSKQASTVSTEDPANLSQNLDEALDLQLGFGALGGLRHSNACEAAERSQRRYDDRQHRLHESRMKRLGLEGEETPEDEMAQQVLIRSPVTNHYHYHYQDQGQPASPQSAATSKPKSTASALVKAALVAAGVLSGAGIGSAIPWLSATRSDSTTPPAQTSVTGPWVETETWDYLPGETE